MCFLLLDSAPLGAQVTTSRAILNKKPLSEHTRRITWTPTRIESDTDHWVGNFDYPIRMGGSSGQEPILVAATGHIIQIQCKHLSKTLPPKLFLCCFKFHCSPTTRKDSQSATPGTASGCTFFRSICFLLLDSCKPLCDTWLYHGASTLTSLKPHHTFVRLPNWFSSWNLISRIEHSKDGGYCRLSPKPYHIWQSNRYGTRQNMSPIYFFQI